MDIKSFIREKIPFYIPLDKYIYRGRKDSFIKQLHWCEDASYEEVSAWQLKKVATIVDYAFLHVPYYHQLYARLGYKPGDLKTWNDFYQLPVLSKDDIKQNLQLFTADEAKKMDASICYTGGSTGKPMAFYLDLDIRIREQAFFEYYWKLQGYHYGEKCIILRGHSVKDVNCRTKLDQTKHYLICDSRCVDSRDETLETIHAMKKFGARVIQAYPSSIYTLAKTCMAYGIDAPHFDIVLLGSENTYPDQLHVIQEFFSVKHLAFHYGHSECAIIAIKYRENNCLGFCPVYGVTEVLDTQHNSVSCGELGELIATGFNRSTPFIRYATGDYAVKSDYTAMDEMKNYFSVERIEGRKHEFIVTKNKRRMSLCTIAGAHLHSLSEIGDMQYEQREIGKLIVWVTRKPGTQSVECNVQSQIANEIHAAIANTGEMDVVVKEVNKIPKSTIGKNIMLVQHIDLDSI